MFNHAPPTDLDKSELRAIHFVPSEEERILRRIGAVIWTLALGCLVFAAVLRLTLLRGLP